MKKILILAFSIGLLPALSYAQKANRYIKEGNTAYQKSNYSEAIKAYQKALQIDPKNEIAKYNLGNAYTRNKQVDKADALYKSLYKSSNKSIRENAYYNTGVNQARNKKLKEAIESFKNSLRLDPRDANARENLQKAINELKNNQQKNKNQQNNKNKQNKPQNKDQQKQNQTPEQKNMNQLFKQMQDQENQLRKKLQNKKGDQGGQSNKDW